MPPRKPIDDWLRIQLSRRTLLAGGLALCGLPARLLGRSGPGPASALRAFSPFKLGIASGDPTPTGVVLWTRLAPDPLEGGGMPPVPVDVRWEVAEDDKMTQVVRRGVVRAAPEWAHSVHADVEGLRPDRWYWYRFDVGDSASAIGRTRTLPPLGAPADRLRFAFVSCQHFETGYFTAYRHLAAEDLDLVFHLGDYIYENAGDPEAGRIRVHSSDEITTLEDYRNRYAQYRTDPDLQAAHAAFPWWVTWDDHEVDNNYANDISENDDPRDAFLLRRAAAYQAYYEHMPLRRAQIPKGPALRLYRDFSYGSLTSFFILDTRQYRTNQPCGDSSVNPPCGGEKDPNATMMGAGAGEVALQGHGRVAIEVERDSAAGDGGARRHAAGPGRAHLVRSVVGLRGAAHAAALISRHTQAGESRRADGRHSQQLGQRSQSRFFRSDVTGRRDRVRRHVDHERRRRPGRARECRRRAWRKTRSSSSAAHSAAT